MKYAKLIFIIMSVCYSLNSQAWESSWVKAVELCEHKKFTEAEEYFTKSIQALEESKDTEHGYIYIDRARLYCILDRFEDALADVNKGLESKNLTD